MKINLTKAVARKTFTTPLLETTDASYLATENNGTAMDSPYSFELEKEEIN